MGDVETRERPVVSVEIYSAVVCPWCYIGKRRFERGVDLVDGEDLGVDFDITYLPFQLDPCGPTRSSLDA